MDTRERDGCLKPDLFVGGAEQLELYWARRSPGALRQKRGQPEGLGGAVGSFASVGVGSGALEIALYDRWCEKRSQACVDVDISREQCVVGSRPQLVVCIEFGEDRQQMEFAAQDGLVSRKPTRPPTTQEEVTIERAGLGLKWPADPTPLRILS